MIKLELPLPPSVNSYYGRTRFGGVYVKAEGKQHQADVAMIFLKSGMQSMGDKRLAMVIDIYPKSNRKQDLDNFGKCGVDSCMNAGMMDDDSQIDFLLFRRQAVLPKVGKMVVSIYEVGEVDILVNEKAHQGER